MIEVDALVRGFYAIAVRHPASRQRFRPSKAEERPCPRGRPSVFFRLRLQVLPDLGTRGPARFRRFLTG